MTDLAAIRIPVDSSDMLRAVKDAKALEVGIKTLVQAHNAGAIDLKQFNSGIVQLKRNYQSTFGVSSQKATAEIRKFTKSVRESVPHVNQAASELNRFGVVAQQTGYQVSDFIVQVQGGTNPLVAFSQQATQLAGLLYYMPERFMAARLAVLGFSISVATAISVVTIGIPLLAMLAMSFFNSGEEADKGAEGVDKYKEAIDSLKSSIQSTQAEINKLSFGTEDDAVAGARKAMLDAQAEVARLTASQTKVRGQFAPTEEESAAIEAAVKNYRDLVINLNELTAKQKALGEAQRMLNGGLSTAAGIQKGLVYDTEVQLRLARELREINSQVKEGLVDPQKNLDIQREYQALLQAGVKPVEAQAEAQYKVERALIQAKIASGQLTNEQNVAAQASLRILDATFAIEDQIRRSVTETSLLEEGISQATIDALKLAGVDITSGIASASAEALKLATQLGISLDTASRLAALGPQGVGGNDPSGGTYSGRGALSQSDIVGMRLAGTIGYIKPPDDKKKRGGDKKDPLGDLQKQLELERELVGTSEAYQKVRQALGDEFRKTSPEVIAGLVQQATEIERLIELEEQRKSIMDTVTSSLEDGFMSMVDGTKSVKDAFKSMAAEIIKDLYRVLVVQRIVGSFDAAKGTGSGLVGFLGKAFTGQLATGGSVMPGKSYLVGENGPELVIPRHSGTVVNANQTAGTENGSGTVVVNNSFNFSANGDESVKRIIKQQIPSITEATKAAVVDAKLRGGSYGKAFR